MHSGRRSELNDDLVAQARELGYSWGKRLLSELRNLQETHRLWPGKLEDARKLVEQRMGPSLGEEEREPLALIVERGARLAWLAGSNENAND